MSKKAFLILGAESSGTRLLTNIFVNSGFAGSAEHEQPWDKNDPVGEKIVWRRSVPHGLKEFPDILSMIRKLRKFQYDVAVAIIHREATATLASQVNNFEAIENAAGALQRYQDAYLYIYDES
ncbi:MAG: hypothetical protein ACKO96_44450 [Flammeovirgaceae bacterium]